MDKQIYAYHVVPFEQVRRGKILADPRYSDPEWLPCYRWLEKQTGFFPLFLSVGDAEAIYVTGYQNQWRVFIGGEFDQDKKYRKIYRKAGEFPNFVLFAFPLAALPAHRFTDYQWWNIVLTEVLCAREVGKDLFRRLFKNSWHRSKWLRRAEQDGHFVQILAPQLDLDRAAFIWARNQSTQKALIDQGFQNVAVKRLPLQH